MTHGGEADMFSSQYLVLSFPPKDIDAKVEKDPEKLPSPVVSLTELGPNLDKLWTYSCSITKGRNVSCMAWNPQNPVSSLIVRSFIC